MWNPLNTKDKASDCRRIRDVLERASESSATADDLVGASEASTLSVTQQEHLAACSECRQAAEDILATRTMLSDMPRHAEGSAPWFAPRVMAAIAVKESELRQSLEAWAAVPRFAARLTWVSALALLLASTWLYKSPQATQNVAQNSRNQSAVESLFDSPQSSASDDVLPAEKNQ
jgi:predicted anti-sigma-YlaC factor YlaD